MKSLSDDEIKEIAERAAERGAEMALEKLTEQLYQEIGKTVMKKVFSLIGVGLVMLAIYAVQKGWIR